MVIWWLVNVARIWPPPAWYPQVSLASRLYKKGYLAISGWWCCWTRGTIWGSQLVLKEPH